MEKTHDYEIAYLVSSELSPEDIVALKDKIAEVAKGQGGEPGEATQWDRRRLAYPIRGKRDGIYIFLPVKATATAVAEIVRQLKLSEPVLRHLVIRTDEK